MSAYIERYMYESNYLSVGAYIDRYMLGSYNDRYMKSYMIEICEHISVNIKSILTDICGLPKFRLFSIDICPKTDFENFHISIKNAKFGHISVKL